jgi:hypothetical protein
MTEWEPQDHCQMAFQNVLNQTSRPNRPENVASTLRPSNTSVHLCHTQSGVRWWFRQRWGFKNQIMNQRAVWASTFGSCPFTKTLNERYSPLKHWLNPEFRWHYVGDGRILFHAI